MSEATPWTAEEIEDARDNYRRAWDRKDEVSWYSDPFYHQVRDAEDGFDKAKARCEAMGIDTGEIA